VVRVTTAVRLPLDDVHEGPADRHQRENAEEKDNDLVPARPEGPHENVRLSHVLDQLQDAEDSQDPQDPQDHEILARREKHSQVGRQNREQIHNTEETLPVTAGPGAAEQAQSVLGGEEEGEEPLDQVEHAPVRNTHGPHTVEHDHRDAGQDAGDQEDVEPPARRGVSLENYPIEAVPPGRVPLHSPSIPVTAEIAAETPPAVLVLVAVDAEVLPVRAVGRVVVMIAVPVVNGEKVPVLFLELPSALGTDEPVNSQGLCAVAVIRSLLSPHLTHKIRRAP
jgi:hypothetical protein